MLMRAQKIQLYLLVFTDFSNKWQKPDDSWEMKQLCGHIGTVRHCQHLQRLNHYIHRHIGTVRHCQHLQRLNHCAHRQHRQTQSINQTNQSCIFRVVQLIHWRWGIIYRESMIISRNEAWNRNVFRRWRKVDRDGHWPQFNHFTEWTHSSLHRIPQFPIAFAICRTFFQVTFNFPDFSMLSRLQLMRSLLLNATDTHTSTKLCDLSIPESSPAAKRSLSWCSQWYPGLTDRVKELHPTQHKIGHSGDRRTDRRTTDRCLTLSTIDMDSIILCCHTTFNETL